ncbi:hypothetical protein NPIL_286021 [Nephila pilipes]|uniref:Uncharacterized protein n=1 Tax=Nephila pilipes TaxID=299642 RepID=A0A8X6Q6S7_NEPPI|nr:hypothetical protein NPIL_286021 [Nephila pilipes]
MEVPKHVKTMRSVSSPPGMPPLSTSTIEPTKTPSYTKPLHSTDSNIRQSKDCRRRHTSVLVPSSSYISELSSSPISPALPDFKDDCSVFFSIETKKDGGSVSSKFYDNNFQD